MSDQDPKREQPSGSAAEPRYKTFASPEERRRWLRSLREDLLYGASSFTELEVLDLETGKPLKPGGGFKDEGK